MYWGLVSSLAYSTRGDPVTQTKTTIFDYGLRTFSVIPIRYLVSGLSRTVLTASNPLVLNPHDTGYKTLGKHLSKIVITCKMTLVLIIPYDMSQAIPKSFYLYCVWANRVGGK